MRRTCPEDCHLLRDPYASPSLAVGDRVDCLFRDRLCVVTGWTDAPIPWPRCRPQVKRSWQGPRAGVTIRVTSGDPTGDLETSLLPAEGTAPHGHRPQPPLRRTRPPGRPPRQRPLRRGLLRL